MKKLILLILFSFCFEANAQVDKIWATYIGSRNILNSAFAEVGTILHDSSGFVYIAGYVSDTIPVISTPGSLMPTMPGSTSGFVAKFDTMGSRIWCSYIGNASFNHAPKIALDKLGNLIVTARSSGLVDYYGTAGSYRPNHPQNNHSYLLKFNSNGVLLWSTYLESAAYSPCFYSPTAVTTDEQNNIIIVGFAVQCTESFSGTFKPTATIALSKGIIFKFSPLGNFLWGSYYGELREGLINVVCDTQSNIYFVGYTDKDTGIASPGAVYPHLRSDTLAESFLVKFSPNGQRLWSTYTGGIGIVSGIVLDKANGLYMLGITKHSTSIATTGTHQPQFNAGGSEFCLSKWDAQNGKKLWGTYYGGTGREREGGRTSVFDNAAFTPLYPKKAIALDAEGRILIVGGTFSINHIKYGCSYRENDTINSGEGFIAKFYNDGHLLWGRYYPFATNTIETSKGNSFYVGGECNITGLATSGSFQPNLIGGASGYLSKMEDNYLCPKRNESITKSGTTLLVNNAYNRYQWYFNDEPIAGANIAQTQISTDTGFYYVRFSDSCNCRYTSDTFYFPPASAAITGMKNDSPYRLYPNPANNSIAVQGPWPVKDNMLQLKIVSVAGRIIWQQKIPHSGNELNYAINLSALPAGMYALLIPTEKGMLLQKFVKE